MSNILKIVDLTDYAVRRALFAVLDGLPPSTAPQRPLVGPWTYWCQLATPNRRNDDAG